MERMNQKEGRYQVVLIGMEDNTEEQKEAFCKEISKRYSVSFTLSKRIIDDCPVILKKSLPLNKAEELVKTFQSFGAIVSVEEMEDLPDIFLEFQDMANHRVALESSQFRKTQ
jgi:ribosomal protein L7/L12